MTLIFCLISLTQENAPRRAGQYMIWVYTKTAQNQNGPQIFDMSKTAHIDVQNAPTQVQNGPELWLKRPRPKRPTVELEVFLAPRVHYMNDVHWVRCREMKFQHS